MTCSSHANCSLMLQCASSSNNFVKRVFGIRSVNQKCNAFARDGLIDMSFERCYTSGTMATLCDCSLAKPRVSASSARSCLVSTDLRAPSCSIFTLTSTQRYARRPVTLRIVHQSRRKCSMKVRAAQQSTGEVSAAKQASMAA